MRSSLSRNTVPDIAVATPVSFAKFCQQRDYTGGVCVLSNLWDGGLARYSMAAVRRAGSSRKWPSPRLHDLQSKPLTTLLAWQWSTCGVLSNAVRQMAHELDWMSARADTVSGSIPYTQRRDNALKRPGLASLHLRPASLARSGLASLHLRDVSLLRSRLASLRLQSISLTRSGLASLHLRDRLYAHALHCLPCFGNNSPLFVSPHLEHVFTKHAPAPLSPHPCVPRELRTRARLRSARQSGGSKSHFVPDQGDEYVPGSARSLRG